MLRKITIGKSDLQTPVIAVGCMRLRELKTPEAAEKFIKTAMEAGANFFDHADCYGNGAVETFFAESVRMSADLREKMILQSKCGITRAPSFDFSKEHILKATDGILKRLKTDYLDILLLHRPDALVEPEEVAEAFDTLHSSGKVRHFGVSNQNPTQIQLLQKFVNQPLIANQLQFSITNATMISAGIHVNMLDDNAVVRDGSVLDFCRLNEITIQPWSPFQYGFFDGVFLDNPKFPELNKKINEIAEKYGVSNTTIALSWILRHPAKMQPVIGTMDSGRLINCIKAAEITLTREEWYQIYLASGNILP